MESQPESIREIVFLIRKTLQARERFSKKLHKEFNVSAPQLATLATLLEQGAMPSSRIATHIAVRASTLTGVIDRLEQKGLVFRTRNGSDRRIITIQLTEAGRELAEKAPSPMQMKIVEGMEKLEQTEQEQVLRSLAKLVDMIEAQDLEVQDEAVVV